MQSLCAQIDKLRVLQAAGLVTAVIPPVEEIPGGRKIHRPAQALAITDKGEEALHQPADMVAQRTSAHNISSGHGPAILS